MEKRPLDATARDPPRSTGAREMLLFDVKWRIDRVGVTHAGYSAAVENTKAVLGSIG